MAIKAGGHILTVNAGSSSIKLALFTADELKQIQDLSVVNIGQPNTRQKIGDNSTPIKANNHAQAISHLLDGLKEQSPTLMIQGIGHRIVHGGPDYHQAQMINDQMLAELDRLTIFDPEHLPVQIEIVKLLQDQFPKIPQIACFDTAFHHDLPDAAKLLAIPRKYQQDGLRRYGFHGLSYTFMMQELARLHDQDSIKGRLILAHLGSGVSLAAVRDGQPVDTTMGLTPAGGVPMSTRSGDIDPGLELYLAQSQGLNSEQFNAMVNSQAGLLGLSEVSADMEQLLQLEDKDPRAKETVALFCYQVKKAIGALTAALGGLDQLVFAGGMGESAPKIRSRVTAGLEFLGIELDDVRNAAGSGIISADHSPVLVRIIHTNEAAVIAAETNQLTKGAK